MIIIIIFEASSKLKNKDYYKKKKGDFDFVFSIYILNCF
jgi:hypothetical protein